MTNVASAPLLGADDDHPRSAALEVGGRLVAIGEEAGRLDDDVDAEIAPGQLLRIADGEHLEQVAGDVDAVVDDADLVGQPAHHRVELEEMGHGLDRAEVVDRDEVDVGARGLRGSEEACGRCDRSR